MFNYKKHEIVALAKDNGNYYPKFLFNDNEIIYRI